MFDGPLKTETVVVGAKLTPPKNLSVPQQNAHPPPEPAIPKAAPPQPAIPLTEPTPAVPAEPPIPKLPAVPAVAEPLHATPAMPANQPAETQHSQGHHQPPTLPSSPALTALDAQTPRQLPDNQLGDSSLYPETPSKPSPANLAPDPTAPKQPMPAMPGEGTEPATLPKPTCPAPVEPPQKTPAPAPDVADAMLAAIQSQGSAAQTGEMVLPGDILAALGTGATGTPGTPPPAAPPMPGQVPLDPKVNTSTNRAASMRLNRFMESAEGEKFPHMQKLFNGNSQDTALYIYIFIIIIYSKYCLYVCEGRYFVNTYSLIPCS